MQETNQVEPIKEAKKLLEVCMKKIDVFMFENKIEQKTEVNNGANSGN